MILRKVKLMERVRIGGLNANNIRYADTAIVADSEEQLQNLITVLADESRKVVFKLKKEDLYDSFKEECKSKEQIRN